MNPQSKKYFWQTIKLPLIFVAIMWAVKLVEVIFNTSFSHYGLYPRTFHGLLGIITTPFLHGDFNHLLSNTLPIVITGFAILNAYPKVAKKALVLIYLLTGFWVWISAREAYHIGASGVVYGMASFLLFMGIFRRDKRSVPLALMVVFLYGTMIYGILPTDPHISWESHALGAIAGLLMAIIYWKVDLEKPQIEDPKDEEVSHLPYWKYNVEGKMKEEYQYPQPEGGSPIQIRYIFKPREKERNDSTDSAQSDR